MRSYLFVILFTFFFVPHLANATILHVPDQYVDIQLAIEHSQDGDTLLIAPGEYYTHLRLVGKGITIASNFIFSGDQGDIQSTIINGNEGVGSIFYTEAWFQPAYLIGLTLTRGRADVGAGVFCQNAALNIDHCTLLADSARNGGGIYALNSNLTLTNTRFVANKGINGGGMLCHGVNLMMTNCRFEGNRAFLGCGLLYEGDSTAVIDSCVVTGSLAMADGGGQGMAINGMISFPPVAISNCQFSNNASEGIVVSQRIATIDDCQFFGNRRGGLSILGDVRVTRCLIYNNTTPRGGGGIRVDSFGRTVLVNSVIYGNQALDGGGVYTVARDSLIVVNSILWGNSPNSYLGVPYFAYCNVFNGAPGDHNLHINPLFVNPERGDFHLRSDSPCIDTGTALFVLQPITYVDLDSSQYIGARPDMGAFEYDPNLVLPEPVQLPRTLELSAYPNPFNSSVTIRYSIAPFRRGVVSLAIFSMDGRQVASLMEGVTEYESQSVTWDAGNLAAGEYLVKLEAGGESVSKQIILVR